MVYRLVINDGVSSGVSWIILYTTSMA
jgi:hypothetical protein